MLERPVPLNQPEGEVTRFTEVVADERAEGREREDDSLQERWRSEPTLPLGLTVGVANECAEGRRGRREAVQEGENVLGGGQEGPQLSGRRGPRLLRGGGRGGKV